MKSGAGQSVMPPDPKEWIAINAWAIRTNSILTAAKIAAHLNRKCRRSRQAGTFDGIEWMCLARFHEACEAKR